MPLTSTKKKWNRKQILEHPSQIREDLHMTMTEFWSIFGVSLARGRRYEMGDTIPEPLQRLMLIGLLPEEASLVEVYAIRQQIDQWQRRAVNLNTARAVNGGKSDSPQTTR